MDKERLIEMMEQSKYEDVFNYDCSIKAAQRAVRLLYDDVELPRYYIHDFQAGLRWERDNKVIDILFRNSEDVTLVTQGLDKDYSVNYDCIGMFLPPYLKNLLLQHFKR